MVLSNKRLKQKLRTAQAETLTAKESEEIKNPKSQSKSFTELLTSATTKPRISKREKRRKVVSLQGTKSVEESNGDSQIENKESNGSEKTEKKKKKKKRKREESGDKEGVSGVAKEKEVISAKKLKKIKMKEKKKKLRMNRKEKKMAKGVESGNVEVKEETKEVEVKEETKVVEESQENTEVATKVYVGGIPYYSTEDDIRSFFESCGTITEMDCMTFPETGKFRGIAMISFKTEAAAKRALALDGADMGGLFLKIQPYKVTKTKKSADFAPKIVEGYNRVYVGNLSWDITEDDLKNLFLDCKISSIRFGEDKTTGQFRGYAHVNFSDSLSLTIALKLDQKEVCGRPVKISCAVPKKAGEFKSKSDSTYKEENKESKSKLDSTYKEENKEEIEEENVSISITGQKKKRRTCYVCGVAGHLSSACPKKKAVDPVKEAVEPVNVCQENKEENDGISSTGARKKRRTCYVCGVPGHLSSSCPKKKAVDPVNVNQE